jgi:hypothetical protein
VDQLSDGLLDRYRADVDFSLATFDSVRTYLGAGDLVRRESFRFELNDGSSGPFSFRGRERPDGTVPGELAYPGEEEGDFVDTGIKNPNATEGALVLADNILLSDSVQLIKEQLRAVRPFGGTPTASALDDLYVVYTDSAWAGGATAKPYVLFITDGAPDDDFREYPVPGCDCGARGDCGAGVDPAAMRCPYPTASEAAKHLHCGFDAARCAGPVAGIQVVTYALDSTEAKLANEAVATSGNGSTAHATTPGELRSSLDAAISRILEDAAKP